MYFVINYLKHYLLFKGDCGLLSFLFKGLNIISIIIIFELVTYEDKLLSIGLLVQYLIILISVVLSIVITVRSIYLGNSLGAIILFLILPLILGIQFIEAKGVYFFTILFLIVISSFVNIKSAFLNYFNNFLSNIKNKKVRLFFIGQYISNQATPGDALNIQVDSYKELGSATDKYLDILLNNNKETKQYFFINNSAGNIYFAHVSPLKYFKLFIIEVVKKELTVQDEEDFNDAINLNKHILFYNTVHIIIAFIIFKFILQMFAGDFSGLLANILIIALISLYFTIMFYLLAYNIPSSLSICILRCLVIAFIFLLTMVAFELAKYDQNVFSYSDLRWFVSVGLLNCFFISLLPFHNSIQVVLSSWLLLRLEFMKAIFTIILASLFILYNPIFPIYLNNKSLWVTMDWIAQGSILFTMLLLIPGMVNMLKAIKQKNV